MSTSKHIDKICCIVLALTIILAVVFVNAESFGVETIDKSLGYESTLFDDSKVHTIDIVMDDWDGFIENCQNEEYELCNLVIDGESYNQVAIRAKGNSSLQQVSSYDNNRYSFKVEFDHYNDVTSYYGLDKLCLNNIIQDNTYMKDYLAYTMMGEFGVTSPLCSYVNITVNGEEWGLYLAVESIEDSFLERNTDGEGILYKPDTSEMGGGKGNGKNFNMDNLENKDADNQDNNEDAQANQNANNMNGKGGDANTQGNNANANAQGNNANANANANTQGNNANANAQGNNGNANANAQGNNANANAQGNNGNANANTQGNNVNANANTQDNNANANANANGGRMQMPGGNMGMGQMPGGNMGGAQQSGDVSLSYTDDSFSSYSNIFDSAKQDITNSDKIRLISALKNLTEQTDLEDSVDIDQVIRYFVVHNFLLNFDSYTGSLLHNYYLYENDGVLSMIPWDYNLSFGCFQTSADSTTLANFPIDTPVSSGTIESRPMLSWIFSNEKYTEMYHEAYAELLKDYFDNGDLTNKINSVKEMIAPYVESDPTKFCTYDEFLKGVDTLENFCTLRGESIQGQLDGTIGSTTETQTDKTGFIDASSINLSDTGSERNTAAGQQGMQNKATETTKDNNTETTQTQTQTDTQQDNTQQGGMQQGGMQQGGMQQDGMQQGGMQQGGMQQGGMQQGGMQQGGMQQGGMQQDGMQQGGMQPPGDMQQSVIKYISQSVILIVVSLIILIVGIIFVIRFNRRRKLK